MADGPVTVVEPNPFNVLFGFFGLGGFGGRVEGDFGDFGGFLTGDLGGFLGGDLTGGLLAGNLTDGARVIGRFEKESMSLRWQMTNP